MNLERDKGTGNMYRELFERVYKQMYIVELDGDRVHVSWEVGERVFKQVDIVSLERGRLHMYKKVGESVCKQIDIANWVRLYITLKYQNLKLNKRIISYFFLFDACTQTFCACS